MPLRDEILAGAFDLANRDDGAIAAALSAGRVKVVPTEIGKGRILATMGLEAGNAFLDIIDSAPDFRHVRHLIANGWLDIGDGLTRAMVDSLVGTVLTSEQASALKALAEEPEVITAQQVAQALEGL